MYRNIITNNVRLMQHMGTSQLLIHHPAAGPFDHRNVNMPPTDVLQSCLFRNTSLVFLFEIL